jgi:hypothetical protein
VSAWGVVFCTPRNIGVAPTFLNKLQLHHPFLNTTVRAPLVCLSWDLISLLFLRTAQLFNPLWLISDGGIEIRFTAHFIVTANLRYPCVVCHKTHLLFAAVIEVLSETNVYEIVCKCTYTMYCSLFDWRFLLLFLFKELNDMNRFGKVARSNPNV